MTTPEPTVGASRLSIRAALYPLSMLVLLGTAWGLSFSLAKIATSAGHHPIGLLMWQAGGAAAITFSVILARRKLGQLRLVNMRYYAFCGTVGIIVPSGAIYWASPHIPAGVLAILIATSTIVTYALALVIRLERKSWRRVLGIMLGFIAVLLILGPDTSLPEPGMAGWALVGMIAPLCYAINPLFIDRFRPLGTDSHVLAFGMLICAFAIITPVALFGGTGFMPGPPWDRVDLAVFGMPVITGCAMLIVFELIRVSGPVYFSMVGYPITAGGVLWGWYLFDERLGPYIWLALAFMLAGLTLVNLRRDTQQTSSGGLHDTGK